MVPTSAAPLPKTQSPRGSHPDRISHDESSEEASGPVLFRQPTCASFPTPRTQSHCCARRLEDDENLQYFQASWKMGLGVLSRASTYLTHLLSAHPRPFVLLFWLMKHSQNIFSCKFISSSALPVASEVRKFSRPPDHRTTKSDIRTIAPR